jgi:hypothetical protein
MKTIQRCLLIFLFLLISRIALGTPFLVIEETPGQSFKPIKFVVTIDSKTSEFKAFKNSEGFIYLQYDLGNLSDGIYTAIIEGVDGKGVKLSVATYSFKKSSLGVESYTPPVPKQKIPPSRGYQGHIRSEEGHFNEK